MSTPHDPERALAPDVLASLVAGCAGDVGEAFFHRLVEHVASALGTKGAWVTEWVPDGRRLRALAFWFDGGSYGAYEYAVDGTPCEQVLERCALVHVPERVIALFPQDPDLAEMGAVSYMGVPLTDTDGLLLGHLAVLHDRPMPENRAAVDVFRVFAQRAEAELRRLGRERELREREQRLARLVESAMDAIIELDGELCVRGMNPAAERTFGCRAGDARGQVLERYLSASSCARLRAHLPQLASLPPSERALWLTDGLSGLAPDGLTFPAEATLSGFELDDHAYYTLILRNVDDRARAEERIRALACEAELLREELDALQGYPEIIGSSSALRAMLLDLERVAPSDATVLITGETGTGKELVARAIHARSPRNGRLLIKVNCAAIAPGLHESELFGHVKGAFTGAAQAREGRFAVADGGTLFLDEVGELPRDLQAKLLRVLQEGEFEPVGSSRTQQVDVRVIAATNRDLEQMVAEGGFRGDLYYRLNVFPLRTPPLRERGEDVLILAERVAARLSRRDGRALRLTESGRARLLRYDWPGNVRELENVIERAHLTTADGRTLNVERALPEADLRASTTAVATSPDSGRILTADELAALERENLRRALEAARWKVAGEGGAAERLGLRPSTLASRMRALGLQRPGHAREN